MGQKRPEPGSVTRRTAVLSVTGATVAALSPTAASSEPADSPPSDDALEPLPVDPDDADVSSIPLLSHVPVRGGVLRAAWQTEAFELVGVTWTGTLPSATRMRLRTRTRLGWTSWNDMTPDGHDATSRTRAGSEPQWVGEADSLEIIVTGPPSDLPNDLTLVLIHPTRIALRSRTSGQSATMRVVAPTDAPVEVYRPWVRTRTAWGADEPLRQNQDDVEYGDVRGAFIHHTATSNDYEPEDVPGIIRSIYRYHVLSRDFFDIGYNFLIDRFGKIWEGAYGGTDRPVVAAHTQYYNSQSFGISAIGNFETAEPSAKMLLALKSTMAWKFATHGLISAYTTASYTNDSARPLPVVSAHRNTKSTACPGGNLYSRIQEIKSGIHDRITRRVPLTLTGPGAANYAEETTLEVGWFDSGISVTGTVYFERRLSSTRWEVVSTLDIVDGRGSVLIRPGGSHTYRVRARTYVTPGVDTRDAVSASHAVTMIRSTSGATALTLRGPATAEYAAPTVLYASWIDHRGPVSGVLTFQRQLPGGDWDRIWDFTITDGQGQLTISPGGSNTYRLRARSASSPSGVPLSGAAATSAPYSLAMYR